MASSLPGAVCAVAVRHAVRPGPAESTDQVHQNAHAEIVGGPCLRTRSRGNKHSDNPCQNSNPRRKRIKFTIYPKFASSSFCLPKVVHRSLGAGSLLLSSFDERDVGTLHVKISDWGFGSFLSALDTADIQRARSSGFTSPAQIRGFVTGEDIYSLGFVFLELILSARLGASGADGMSGGTTGTTADQGSLQRLYEDIFESDMMRIRSYCLEEDAWVGAVEMLDQDGNEGWEMLGLMLAARTVGLAGVSEEKDAGGVSARLLAGANFLACK